jgi:hypothetical protein
MRLSSRNAPSGQGLFSLSFFNGYWAFVIGYPPIPSCQELAVLAPVWRLSSRKKHANREDLFFLTTNRTLTTH